MARRRIQPKPSVELETVTLRFPAQLVRSVDQYAKHLGDSTDRTYVIGQAIEIALAQDKELPEGARAPGRRDPRERVATVTTCLYSTVVAGGAQSAPPAPSRNTRVFTAALSATPGRAVFLPLF